MPAWLKTDFLDIRAAVLQHAQLQSSSSDAPAPVRFFATMLIYWRLFSSSEINCLELLVIEHTHSAQGSWFTRVRRQAPSWY